MIELQDVRFSYPHADFRLRVDRLTVEEGASCCWIGPSGSGKTTLLHLIAGIIDAEQGDVRCSGAVISEMSESARREFRITSTGLVFQDFALLDYLSVMDNILLPYRISRHLKLDAAARSRAMRLAESMGLADKIHRRPSRLSQGERQRIAVCRAIVTKPSVVLADEPTANLDAMSAAHVLDALRDYSQQEKATLIVVSHDPHVIENFDQQTDVSRYCETAFVKGHSQDA